MVRQRWGQGSSGTLPSQTPGAAGNGPALLIRAHMPCTTRNGIAHTSPAPVRAQPSQCAASQSPIMTQQMEL